MCIRDRVKAVDKAMELLTDRHKRIFEMVYIHNRRDRYNMSDELHEMCIRDRK